MAEVRKYVFSIKCANGHEQPNIPVNATDLVTATEQVALGELIQRFCPTCRQTLIPKFLYCIQVDEVLRR